MTTVYGYRLCPPVCTYLSMPTCLCLPVYAYLSMPTCLCLPVYAYLSVPTSVPMCLYLRVCVYVSVPTCLWYLDSIDQLNCLVFAGWSSERLSSGSTSGRLATATVVWL
jgi:hypothetical protein